MSVVARMIAAGVAAELIEDVALELARGRVALEAIEQRRCRDRERQQAHRHAASRDAGDAIPAKENPPHPLKKNTPPCLSPEGDSPPRRRPGRAKARRGSRLPDGFVVPAAWLQWARDKRGWAPADAGEEAACFCRYWQARSGPAAVRLDWEKSWRNWVVNSHRPDGRATSGGGGDGGGRRLSPAEQAARLEERARFNDRIGRADEAADQRSRAAALRRRQATGPPGQPIAAAAARVMDQQYR